MCRISLLPFRYFFNMNIDQMKWTIHIRFMQQFLYFKSHKKIIKTAMYTLLFVSVYFLSVPHLQYQHILLTSVLFKKWTVSLDYLKGQWFLQYCLIYMYVKDLFEKIVSQRCKFADPDSTMWKSGDNLVEVSECIQKDINEIME